MVFTLPSLSYSNNDDEVQLPSNEVRSSAFGEEQGYLSRLLFGPRPRVQEAEETQQVRLGGRSGVGTIKLDSLRGGFVSYDIVESLEFHHPILNTPWFFKKVHGALKRNGVKSLTFTSRAKGFDEEVNTPRRELRQSLTLIPEILEQKGDRIAESVFGDLKRELKLSSREIDPSALAELVQETEMTVEQIKELRKFLIDNSLNEDELVDAIHMSTYKASHIIATELRKASGLLRLGERQVTTYTGLSAAATVGAGSWATFSVLNYLEQLTFYGMEWGESFIYEGGWRETLTYLGRDYDLERHSWSSDRITATLEELQRLGLDASSLVGYSEDVSVGIPYVSFGATAVAALTLGYFAPKLWTQSKPYLALLRNKFLNSYLRVLRMEGLLTPRVVSQHRNQVMGLISQMDSSDLDTRTMNFDEASDIRNMRSALSSDEPISVSSEGFATQVMVLGQHQMRTGTDILGHFTKDMALWFAISKFYKTELNRLLRATGDIDFTRTREVVQAYQEKLNNLSERIEAYEMILSLINASVEEHISFLRGLLENNAYHEYVEIRDDGVSDYEVRARNTIEDRISDLVAFHGGTLTIIRLSLSNAYDANYAEQRDLQKIIRVTSSSALAITEAQMGELNQTLIDLVQRKVGEVVSQPGEATSASAPVSEEPVVSVEARSCYQLLSR